MIKILCFWLCFGSLLQSGGRHARKEREPFYWKWADALVSPLPQADDRVRIIWDRNTLRRVSGEGFGFSGYARMIQLHDSSLLCVYEADGSIMGAKSIDLGKTWSKPVAVAWRQNGINMAAPDVIELRDHSILACYNPRPYRISGSRCFGIRTRISRDGGKTWLHGRLLYEAGHKFTDGCWEPSAIQLPDGEIQVYFANENPFRKSNEQEISVLRSFDGGYSWTEKPVLAGFRAWGRDGMPSPLLLKNGDEIVCAIEDSGWFGYLRPAILRSPVRNPWSPPVEAFSPDRSYAISPGGGFWWYAGAPCIRQLSTGETLLSYQGTGGRRHSMRFADMKIAIGDSHGRHFRMLREPFNIPGNRCGLWNSLAVLNDDTVVALTTTNAYSGRSEVWMIKGYVVRSFGFDSPD